MKGLILKDIMNLKKQGYIYLVLIAFYGIIGFMGKNSSFMGGMICVLITMIPVTALSYDERSNWDKYALSMPVSRKDIVISKYVLGLICSGVGLLCMFLFNLVSPSDMESELTLNLIFFGISILYISLILPMLFKFGAEKARILMMAAFLAPALIIFLGAKLQLPVPNEQTIKYLIISAPVLLILIFIFSLLLSVKIYKKKEL